MGQTQPHHRVRGARSGGMQRFLWIAGEDLGGAAWGARVRRRNRSLAVAGRPHGVARRSSGRRPRHGSGRIGCPRHLAHYSTHVLQRRAFAVGQLKGSARRRYATCALAVPHLFRRGQSTIRGQSWWCLTESAPRSRPSYAAIDRLRCLNQPRRTNLKAKRRLADATPRRSVTAVDSLEGAAQRAGDSLEGTLRRVVLARAPAAAHLRFASRLPGQSSPGA